MDSTIKYLTASETDELFKSIIQRHTVHQERNLAIFYIATYCALRVSEIGRLKIFDYDCRLKQIYCRRKKNSNNNTIRIIDKKVTEALENYLDIRCKVFPDSDILFISQKGNPMSRQMLDKLMKFYCEGTSIPTEKRHFHLLKHTRAIELSEKGLRMEDVQWWLGHKNIKNTQIYAQFTTKQQEAIYRHLQHS